jgi:hypothetical protein
MILAKIMKNRGPANHTYGREWLSLRSVTFQVGKLDQQIFKRVTCVAGDELTSTATVVQ